MNRTAPALLALPALAIAFAISGCGQNRARTTDLAPAVRGAEVSGATIVKHEAPAAVSTTTTPVAAVTASANAKTAPTPKPERHWLGVAPSPRSADVLAAWTSTEVLLSSDGGKTFRSILTGHGQVEKVAIDARGVVFAVRHHDELGVRSTDGITRWRSIPHATKTLELAVAAGAVTWHGVVSTKEGPKETLAISRDDGDTWTFPDVPPLGNAGNHVSVEKNGAIALMIASEADCGGGYQARFVGNVAGGEWKHVDWPLDTPAAFGVGASGWSYGVGVCGDGAVDPQRLCGAGADGSAVLVLPETHARKLDVVTDGSATWATIDGRIASLDKGTVRFPAKVTPRGFHLTGIDAEGQPIGVAGGVAVKLTRTGSWQGIFAAPKAKEGSV